MLAIRLPAALVATLLMAGALATSRADEIGSAMVSETSAVVREGRENHESNDLAEMQQRLAALEAQLQGGMSGGYEMQGAHGVGGQMVEPSCGCGHPAQCGCEECCCCNPCCKCGGVFVDAEFVYLKPHNSSGTGFSTAGLRADAALLGIAATTTVLDFSIDPDYAPTPRLAAGFQLADGLGVRARYWEFDHTFDGPATLGAGTVIDGVVLGVASSVAVFHNWDTNVSDLEVFDATDFGGWSLTWSAGFRYVQYEEDRGLAPVAVIPVAISFRKNFHGIGLTAGFESRRRVTNNLGVFANARASVIMGDEENRIDIIVGAPPALAVALEQEQRNDVKQIYEAQVGAEYTLPMCGGGYLFARGGAEIQFWDNFGVSTTNLLADESTGFGGFFAAAGVAR